MAVTYNIAARGEQNAADAEAAWSAYTPPTPPKCALYGRKSTVDAKRPGKSVADQLREARAEAERRGWTVVAELSDDGASASRHARRGVQRHGWNEVVRLVGEGGIDAIIMAEQSRATRSLSELASLIELCADTGTRLVVGGTDVDPSRPEGFLLAGVTGAVDAAESERARQRTLRGLRGAALAGRPAGKPVYGYRRVYGSNGELVRVDVDEVQAAVVREIVDRALGGESMRSITNSLNDRGIPTPAGGKEWHPVTVRRVAINPAYAARRVHQGVVVGPGNWPPIIPPERHEAVRSLLTSPSRVTRPGATRHLLSGTARCGECGGPMRVVLDRKRPTYCCFTRGCFKVAVGKAHLDEFVAELVLARLERPDVADALAAAGGDGAREARERVQALAGRRQQIIDALVDGSLDPMLAQQAEQRLAAQIEAAEAEWRASVGSPLVAGAAGPDVRARWEAMSGEQRAALVRAVVGIVVQRSQRPRGTTGFDASRVDVTWLT